jgi:hypothetical protein
MVTVTPVVVVGGAVVVVVVVVGGVVVVVVVVGGVVVVVVGGVVVVVVGGTVVVVVVVVVGGVVVVVVGGLVVVVVGGGATGVGGTGGGTGTGAMPKAGGAAAAWDARYESDCRYWLLLWPGFWAGADGGSGLRAIVGTKPGVGVGPDGVVGVGATTGAMPNCGPDGEFGLVGTRRSLTPLEWPRPIKMTSPAKTRPAAITMRRQNRDWSGTISAWDVLMPASPRSGCPPISALAIVGNDTVR